MPGRIERWSTADDTAAVVVRAAVAVALGVPASLSNAARGDVVIVVSDVARLKAADASLLLSEDWPSSAPGTRLLLALGALLVAVETSETASFRAD